MEVVNSLRSNASRSWPAQLAAELAWLLLAVFVARWLHGQPTESLMRNLEPAIVFASIMVTLNFMLGLYRRPDRLSLSTYVGRLVLAMAIGAPIAYVSVRMLPGGMPFQQIFGDVLLLAFVGLVAVQRIVVSPLLRTRVHHNVLVMGTGPEARGLEASFASGNVPSMRLVGFYSHVEQVNNIRSSKVFGRDIELLEVVNKFKVDEIIVAMRDQRGGVLPLRALLECRLHGIQVTDLPRFFERVHGQIPIEAVKASWLIYGDGFRQDFLRTVIKRTFDIVASLVLVTTTLPLMVLVAILLSLESGVPIIYRQERVGLRGRTFQLLKFRSMRADAEADGKPVWAKVADPRVTRLGAWLRRTRVDELPQLLNVLRGEMSLVGPRPERPVFVEMLTQQIPFYSVRHSVKPGLTGWAQVRYSYGANVEQSMRKLEYDLYYVKNHSLFLDFHILFATVRVVMRGEGAR
jgi:sugar transferase (PEP-CTERM system associated)